MSLAELIAGVEAHEKTLTVFNPSEGVTETVREHFSDRNVSVEAAAADGPSNYMVLGEGDEFLAAASVDDLLDDDPYDPAFDERTYRPILDHLDETMFTSYDRGRMLAASREIEDRAWRVGKGQLHAGFQFVGNVEAQRDTYERLGNREDLDVHVYAVPEDDYPSFDGVTTHFERCEELRESWFVVFDGGGVEESKCALVAEERDEGTFYGFWTYEPTTVDYVVNHLHATYAPAESGGDDQATTAGE